MFDIIQNPKIFLQLQNSDQFPELYEIEENIFVSKCAEGYSVGNCSVIKKKYAFSKIFDLQPNQREIFNNAIKPRILDCLNGVNYNLLTCGAPGLEEAYLTLGTPTDPGIIPRSLEYLFKSLPNISKNPKYKPISNGNLRTLSNMESKQELAVRNEIVYGSNTSIDRNRYIENYKMMEQCLSKDTSTPLRVNNIARLEIWISFAKICREHVYDLLKSRGSPQKVYLNDSKRNAYIKGLTSINVSSGFEAYQILQFGCRYLNYYSASMNTNFSRSNYIFMIKLVHQNSEKTCLLVKHFNFCDLIGSVKSNKSLNALLTCINIIKCNKRNKSNKKIPVKASKTTQVFEKALLGEEKMCLIVRLNPTKEKLFETQRFFNLFAKVKVVVERQGNKNKDIESLNNQMVQLKTEEQKTVESNNEMEIQKQIIKDNNDLFEHMVKSSEKQFKNIKQEEIF